MNDITQVQNPFGNSLPVRQNQQSVTDIEEVRAAKEVESSLVIAKRFPRDQANCMDKILKSCMRPSLAEVAQYSYPRGGIQIFGPSVHLARAMLQSWGNCQSGLRELSRNQNASVIEAYCWDLEANNRQSKIFTVDHTRFSKTKGITRLVDPRDIYEMAANLGSRRLRGCILDIIPRDVVDAAVKQCNITLQASVDLTPEGIKKMVKSFDEFGVKQEMIVKRLGHRLDAISSAEMLSLKKIYVSLRDEMSVVKDWFDTNGNSDQKSTNTFTSPKQPTEKKYQRAQTEEIPSETSEQKPITDRFGEIYDKTKHAANLDGDPVLNADGSFRKRRKPARGVGEPSPKDIPHDDTYLAPKNTTNDNQAPFKITQGDILKDIREAETEDVLNDIGNLISELDTAHRDLPNEEYRKRLNEIRMNPESF